MEKKITTRVNTLKAIHRKQTMGLDLSTRIADKRNKKYDTKKDRKNWRKNNEEF